MDYQIGNILFETEDKKDSTKRMEGYAKALGGKVVKTVKVRREEKKDA